MTRWALAIRGQSFCEATVFPSAQETEVSYRTHVSFCNLWPAASASVVSRLAMEKRFKAICKLYIARNGYANQTRSISMLPYSVL